MLLRLLQRWDFQWPQWPSPKDLGSKMSGSTNWKKKMPGKLHQRFFGWRCSCRSHFGCLCGKAGFRWSRHGATRCAGVKLITGTTYEHPWTHDLTACCHSHDILKQSDLTFQVCHQITNQLRREHVQRTWKTSINITWISQNPSGFT